MRLAINTAELQKRITQAMPFVAKGQFGSPDFLIETNAKGVAALSANAGATGFRAKLNATAVEAGKVCIPAALLANFVANVSAETTTLYSDADHAFNLHVAAEGYRCIIHGIDPDDFTQLAKSGSESCDTGYTSLAIANAIHTVDYAISDDGSKGALCGLRLLIAPGTLTFAATDGFRCAETTLPLHTNTTIEREVVIPKAGLAAILHALKGDEQPLSIVFSETRIVFQTAQYLAASATIATPFPKYERGFIDPTITVTLPRKELLNMVAAASVFHGEKIKTLALAVTPEGIGISTASEQESGASEIAYGCAVAGATETLTVGFNAKDMSKALEVLSTEKIILGFCGLRKPIWIKAPGNDQLRTIIVPIGLGGTR